jgi:hypothetical protein
MRLKPYNECNSRGSYFQAIENKFSVQISNSDLLTATFEKLLKSIQRQLDYHLPPPPTSDHRRFSLRLTQLNHAKQYMMNIQMLNLATTG